MHMSYCRFENMLRDLNNCKDVLEALFTCDVADGSCLRNPISPGEIRHAANLIETCKDILQFIVEDQGIRIDLDEISADEIEAALADANESFKIAKEEHRLDQDGE